MDFETLQDQLKTYNFLNVVPMVTVNQIKDNPLNLVLNFSGKP
jgi:hypothetical protein